MYEIAIFLARIAQWALRTFRRTKRSRSFRFSVGISEGLIE
jgi:hypothetical protein